MTEIALRIDSKELMCKETYSQMDKIIFSKNKIYKVNDNTRPFFLGPRRRSLFVTGDDGVEYTIPYSLCYEIFYTDKELRKMKLESLNSNFLLE